MRALTGNVAIAALAFILWWFQPQALLRRQPRSRRRLLRLEDAKSTHGSDLDRYDRAIIRCRRFTTSFGVADLTRHPPEPDRSSRPPGRSNPDLATCPRR